jgi:TolA-binding protein
MRALAACILSLGLAVSPAMASPAAPGDKDNAATSNSSSSSTAAAQPANTPAAAADPATKAEPSSMEVSAELQQLRELLESQARQLAEQQQKMDLLEEQLKAAIGATAAAAPADGESVSGVASAAIASNAALGGGASDDKPGPPTSIQFKGITLTPGGFFAAETVWRSKALASDVNTPFNSAPFEGASNAHMSEFQASGRQSRISMLMEGKLDNVKIGGYYEADFLSAATTSNNNQSNSYALRQRQIWGQAAFISGWTFTGGQQWSLLTETTHGMDNRTEALPQVIDAQYVAGFSWARQYGFRVTKNFNNKFWLGASIEEGQATLTTHGNPTATCAPANPTLTGAVTTGLCSASALDGVRVATETAPGTFGTTVLLPNVYNNFLLGAFGTTGGLYNPLANYQYNPAPDIIVKAVFEPGFGHYEVGGMFSDFRDRVFPCVTTTATFAACGTLPTSATTTVPDQFSAAGAYNDNRAGGGIFANARWNLLQKKVDVGLHFLGGDGIGRYGSAGLSDLTTRYVATTGAPSLADGTLAPIRNFQALGTLQFHPTPKLDINLYVGGEFEARAQYQKTAGGAFNEGYGATGLSNFGCNQEVLPFAAQSTSSSTGVPTGVAGGTGFIPGAVQNCTGDTRNLIEGTISFWYRFYKGPKGTVQYGMQYSNYVRNTWRGVASGTGADGLPYSVPNGAPHSDENMVFTSFRYVLP